MADGQSLTPSPAPPVYDDGRWHIVCTNAKQERLARYHLLRAGHEVYLPQRLVKSPKGLFARALFPGYLFVRVRRTEEWSDIFLTIGVRSALSRADRPGPIPAAVVDQIKNAEIDGFVRLVGDPGGPCAFEPGQKVRVGALAGIFLERVDSTRCRLLVSLIGSDSRPCVTKLSKVS